jgi:hypothetical protein
MTAPPRLGQGVRVEEVASSGVLGVDGEASCGDPGADGGRLDAVVLGDLGGRHEGRLGRRSVLGVLGARPGRELARPVGVLRSSRSRVTVGRAGDEGQQPAPGGTTSTDGRDAQDGRGRGRVLGVRCVLVGVRRAGREVQQVADDGGRDEAGDRDQDGLVGDDVPGGDEVADDLGGHGEAEGEAGADDRGPAAPVASAAGGGDGGGDARVGGQDDRHAVGEGVVPSGGLGEVVLAGRAHEEGDAEDDGASAGGEAADPQRGGRGPVAWTRPPLSEARRRAAWYSQPSAPAFSVSRTVTAIGPRQGVGSVGDVAGQGRSGAVCSLGWRRCAVLA